LEDGSDVMSKEETAQLASRQEKYIVNLKNALIRMKINLMAFAGFRGV